MRNSIKRSSTWMVGATLALFVAALLFAQAKTGAQEKKFPISTGKYLPADKFISDAPAKAVHKMSKMRTLPANAVKSNVRKAIPFKAFTLTDLKAGKGTTPGTLIPLKNGRKIKAQDYLAQLNKLEQALNKVGHTLRKKGDTLSYQVIHDPAKLQRQVKLIAATHLIKPVKGNPQRRYSALALKDAHATALKNYDLVLLHRFKGAVVPANDVEKVLTKSWSSGDLGNASSLTVNWNARVEMKGKVRVSINPAIDGPGEGGVSSLHGETNINGSIFGNPLSLMRMTGDVTSPKTGKASVSFTVAVAGQTIYNPQLGSPMFYASKKYEKSLPDNSFDGLNLGWFVASVGVRGSVGFDYSLSAVPFSIDAAFHSYVKSSVYARAGVALGAPFSIADVEVGVEGNLTLINCSFDMGGNCDISVDDQGFYFGYAYHGQYDVEALSGKLLLYADGVAGFGFLRGRIADYTIWDWSGLRDNQTFLYEPGAKVYFR